MWWWFNGYGTHKKYLDQIIERIGKLPYPEIPNPNYKKEKKFNLYSLKIKKFVWI